jgi:hypothetical protein
LEAAHFWNDPELAVVNLEKPDAPLGYVDRKYAYPLSLNDGTKKANPNVIEEERASVYMVFTTNGS